MVIFSHQSLLQWRTWCLGVSQQHDFLHQAAEEAVGVLAGAVAESPTLQHTSLALRSLLIHLGGEVYVKIKSDF